MKTYSLIHDVKQAPGSWWIDVQASTVRASCPNCGCKADLSSHAVNNAGKVFPSVKCPGSPEVIALTKNVGEYTKVVSKPPCGFHANVVLLGWPKNWEVSDGES